MANRFFDPGAERAEKVNHLFGAIARRYDLINDVQSLGLHRLWKRRVVHLAQPAPGRVALDLCCGTGDLALALAGCGAKVIGVDFSRAMLGVAAARRGAGGRSVVGLACGDALRLPVADAACDIVTVGYGLRNLADLPQGLREIWRVLAPGGRLVALDFGKPDFIPWRAAYYAYLRLLVPGFGLLFCGNASAYAYILESLRHYPAQRGVDTLLGELGAVNRRIVNLLGGAMSINYAEKPARPATDR
jgi:demethylmenaquinone methyltransferase/2-methoxy-6-polyprenyl-1,4-benzoquinol methylase